MQELRHNAVHQGDCVAGLRKVRAESIDLAFADPPFNIGYAYDAYDDRRDRNSYVDWSASWMAGVVRALKPDGTFWLAIGDEYAAELKLIAQDKLGLTCRSWVIWYYTFGVNCTRKFSRSHAHLLYFVKDPKCFTFNDRAIRIPSARQLVYADRRANPKGRLPDDTWIYRPQDLLDGFQPDHDVWYFPRVCGTFQERAGWHGCQMPEMLLGRIIEACSNPGDVVLDPFAGSGTTLAVAKKLHRGWVGFELSKDYFKRVRKRLNQTKPGAALHGAADPLRSVPRTSEGRRRGGRPRPRLASKAPAKHRAAPVAAAPGLGRVAADNGEYATALVEAYLRAADGFSVDRMLADPDLSGAFLQACRDLGIPGGEANWGQQLLRLRKAGGLKGLPRPRQTTIPRDDMDQFSFASEIAWQILADEHKASLDRILSDPKLASEFDTIAGRFAPGFKPFEYRWGALTLRKRHKDKRDYAHRLPPDIKRKSFSRRRWALGELDGVPVDGGLYLIQAARTRVYLGETCGLRRRLKRQGNHLAELFAAAQLNGSAVEDAVVKVLTLPAPHDDPTRLGLQFHLLDEWGERRPRMNLYDARTTKDAGDC